MENDRYLIVRIVAFILWILATESLKIEVKNGSTTIKTYTDKSAFLKGTSYGFNGYIYYGELVYPNPRNACSEVESTSSRYPIAFVLNYDDCPATNAEYLSDAKYELMLAYSENNSKISAYDFPQALVNKAFADFLVENAVNETNITVYVSEDYIALYERLLIVIGLVLLCAIAMAVLVFFCTCCCRWGLHKWRRRGLTHWRIKQLPRRRYRSDRESTESCSICLEDFKEKEYLRVLPCDHVFHPACVDEWLKNWNRVCPLCKTSISRSRSRDSQQQREHEPLLSDLESTSDVESSTYGSIRLSDANTDGRTSSVVSELSNEAADVDSRNTDAV